MASALINIEQPTVAACIRRAYRKGHLSTWNITGDYVSQVLEIRRFTIEWWYDVHIIKGWVPAMHCGIVIESFHIDQVGVDPIPLQILSGLEVLAQVSSPSTTEEGFFVKQTPSEQSFCSDQMLKDWSLWKHKTPHERSALKHLAKRIDKLLQEGT